VNDRIAVEKLRCGQDAILELLRCDADVAQDGPGEFGKEALDEIEPGTVRSQRTFRHRALDAALDRLIMQSERPTVKNDGSSL
jgi:hypothetical protein